MGASLEQRLQELESRLTRIENQLQLRPIATSAAPNGTSQLQQVNPVETVKSSNWLASIAIICFVLAAAFIIKLSLDSGWLTPIRQIGIAIALGGVLIGSGFMLRRLDKAYASFLPGAGIVIFYLSDFAAHRLYHFITFEAALMLAGIVSLLCIGLYLKMKENIYLFIAATGAFLAPFLLSVQVNAAFTLYYYLICSIGFTIVSILARSRLLMVVTAYLVVIATTLVALYLTQNELSTSMLAAYFVVFAIGNYCYTKYTKVALTMGEAKSFFLLLLIFYCVEYALLSRISANLAAWVALSFAGFILFVYLLAKKLLKIEDTSGPYIFAFVSIVFFHAGYMELLPIAAGPWLFLTLLIGLAFLPPYLEAQTKQRRSSFTPVLILIGVILCLEYWRMANSLFINLNTNWWIVVLSVLSLWMLYIKQSHHFVTKPLYGYLLLSATHLIAILALYDFIHEHGSLAVSASWLFYAVSVMIFGFVRKDKLIVSSALLVLGVSAAKVLLYDVQSATALIRIFCLLLTGTVLYGAGLLFKKISTWDK